MYRKELDSRSDFLEDGFFSVYAKAKRTKDNFQMGGHVMLDVPLGWAYAGYDQKYGAFGGLGFNVTNHLSVGFGYEQTIANYVAELGGSYDVVVSYQFGGKHHIKKPIKTTPPEPTVVTPPTPKVVTPTVTETKTPTVETPKTTTKTPTVQEELDKRIRVVEDPKIEGIAQGYYVIAGVFQNPKGAYQMRRDIENLGIKVFTFKNKENGMHYIYIDRAYESRGEAGETLLNLLKRPEFKNSNIWVLKVGNL
jgi:sporulation domain protein